MSSKLTASTNTRAKAFALEWGRLTAALSLVCLLVAATVYWRTRPVASQAAPAAAESPASGHSAVVQLTPAKLQSAGLHVGRCETRELKESRTVAGRIAYNEARQLRIKAPADAIVEEVWVSPAQAVKQGDRLARLSSREIGLVRDAVAQCRAELNVVQREAQRAAEIDANLTELLAALASRPPLADVETPFADKVLGEYRQTILAAYSKLHLASAVMADTRRLEQDGGLSGRTIQERRSNLEIAKAAFETACEQSRFDAAQDLAKAVAAQEHAERLLAVNCRRLETLGDDCAGQAELAAHSLSELMIRAPFDGVVEQRLTLPAAHVTAGQALFVLANIDTLWLTAEAPERDWNALESGKRETLAFHVPSLANSETVARVKFTEGAISAETLTLTIVAEFDNSQQRFRPGMFAWAALPTASPRHALMAPVSAVVAHEQSQYVFVVEDERTFRPVSVATGATSDGWIEIASGLVDGQPIVDQGAFVLKSEWLLEESSDD